MVNLPNDCFTVAKVTATKASASVTGLKPRMKAEFSIRQRSILAPNPLTAIGEYLDHFYWLGKGLHGLEPKSGCVAQTPSTHTIPEGKTHLKMTGLKTL